MRPYCSDRKLAKWGLGAVTPIMGRETNEFDEEVLKCDECGEDFMEEDIFECKKCYEMYELWDGCAEEAMVPCQDCCDDGSCDLSCKKCVGCRACLTLRVCCGLQMWEQCYDDESNHERRIRSCGHEGCSIEPKCQTCLRERQVAQKAFCHVKL